MRRSRGFTLVEMLVAIAVAALLILLMTPRIRTAMIKSNVRGARGAVITMFQQAKVRAIQEVRRTTLNFDDTKVWITAKPRRAAGVAACGCDTVGAIQNLQTQYGVTLERTVDTFAFDPRGLGMLRSSNAVTVRIIRSGVKDSVMISGFGKVAK